MNLAWHIDQRRALGVVEADRVEHDRHRSALCRDHGEMGLYRVVVGSIDRRDVGAAARALYVPGHSFEPLASARREEDPRAFACEGFRHRATDCSARSIDDR